MQWHPLTHWGRVTHICVSELSIIGSDNGLSPGRRQAIICTSGGILLIRTSGTNFSEILSEVHTFSFKKMLLNMSSGKWRPFCLGLNMLTLRNVQCDGAIITCNTANISHNTLNMPNRHLIAHTWGCVGGGGGGGGFKLVYVLPQPLHSCIQFCVKFCCVTTVSDFSRCIFMERELLIHLKIVYFLNGQCFVQAPMG